MPLLMVQVSEHPNSELSHSIACTLTELTERHLHKKPDLTAVAVNFVTPDSWFVGNRSLQDHDLKSFALEVKVTAATNTKPEMTSFNQAVFEAMKALLGALHETSYIVVHEVPANAWGYGGVTQEFRFIAGQLHDTGAR